MKTKVLLFFSIISLLTFTGCQSNDLSAQNQALKQQISELEHQLTQLQEANNTNVTPTMDENTNTDAVSPNATDTSSAETPVTIYTLQELSAMVDEFVASVGSATPDVNNSSNLDQFFSLKRQGDQIEHALENHENDLEDQYRASTITREDYRKLDREIEKLEELIDSACDRLEIAFGIDD